MYKIIGADQKEYGPVSSDQIRQWIAEGRVSLQTLARSEDTRDWKPLSAFSEFGGVPGAGIPSGAPPPLSASGDGREAALRRVKAPAIALMATAGFGLLRGVWSFISSAFFPSNLDQYNSLFQQLHNPQLEEFVHRMIQISTSPIVIIVSALFGLAMSVLILMGALRMKSLRSYEFSMTAAILGMVPCVTPCCFLGLPFGIWALIVLRSPEVKSQFH